MGEGGSRSALQSARVWQMRMLAGARQCAIIEEIRKMAQPGYGQRITVDASALSNAWPATFRTNGHRCD